MMCDIEQYFFRLNTAKELVRIVKLLELLNKRMAKMSAELDELIVQVEETQGVEQSVITLLQGIEARLEELIASELDLAATKAELVKLTGDLHVSEVAVADAVAAFPTP